MTPVEGEILEGEPGAIVLSFAVPNKARVRAFSDKDGDEIGRMALEWSRFDVIRSANAVLVDQGFTRARAR